LCRLEAASEATHCAATADSEAASAHATADSEAASAHATADSEATSAADPEAAGFPSAKQKLFAVRICGVVSCSSFV